MKTAIPDVVAIDLTSPRNIHLVGIGGAGVSGIATILASLGHRVSGSDQQPSDTLDRLAGLGVITHVGHDGDNLGEAEIVAASTAISAENPEIVAARASGLPVLRRADPLAAISRLRPTLVISGTHGKTTTTAMVTQILNSAGRSPSYLVGAEVMGLGAAHWAPVDGGHFVVEGDESDGTFGALSAAGSIVTNIEDDHLDYYGDLETLHNAFTQFLAETEGPRVICVDDQTTARIASEVGDCVTYGVSTDADYTVRDIVVDGLVTRFVVDHTSADGVENDASSIAIELGLPGAHLALNATGALALCHQLGVSFADIAAGLAATKGVSRRFEQRGEHNGIVFVDDYAHLPAEVAANVATAGAGGWTRVVAVFQPHRYSRTEALGTAFADSFVGADIALITDVYAAGEEPRPGVTGRILVDAVAARHPDLALIWVPTREGLVTWLVDNLAPGDLCLGMGAGDIALLADEVLDRLGADTP